MRGVRWLAAGACAAGIRAASTATSVTTSEGAGLAVQSYVSYSSTETVESIAAAAASLTSAASVISGTVESSTTTAASTNGTATTGSSAGTHAASRSPLPSNITPCNGYVEFCNRNYSNITFVGAHNSPFAVPNNAGSNQDYGVVAQLNDGVRMLQGQTHLVDGVLHYCHTTCDLLDAGPAEDYFANVTQWLAARENRFEVVTLLIGNGDYSAVGNFTAPLINSGLHRYAYTPPKIPMGLHDWPTLGQLILNNTRAIIFMDYDANQTAVPYILDEFSQVWETPFDPTNNSFPCVVQRPPKLGPAAARDRLYLLNNNLNVELDLLGTQIFVPNLQAINTTNAVSGVGSLGAATQGCAADWGRPPNYLLVDYYNGGNFPGSVFEVAARANNVTFQPFSCCGLSQSVSGAGRPPVPVLASMLVTLAVALVGW